MKRLVTAALVLTLAVAAFSIGASLALFTDTDSVPGNSFTTAASFGLVSNGLVDRYFIEEAASGQSPTELVDAAPSPLNLPVIYDGTNPTYKEISTGRGWESTTTTNQGRASILVDGTKVQTLLNGSTQGTIEVVLQVDAVTTLWSRFSHVGTSSESGYFTISSPNLNQLNLYMLGNTLRGQWDPAFGTSGRIVLTLVYDSTLSTAADRVKLYKDGALLTKTGGTDPPQNETISIPNGTNFVIANRELCCRSFDGDIYYAAHYNTALTAGEVSDNSNILLTNDDSAPISSCTAGDTGFLSATAEAADTGGDGDGFESNPTGAFADAGGIASNINGNGDRHRYYDYAISIPAGCEIAGIEVQMDWWLDAVNGTNSMDVELSWDGGTTWTAAKTDTLETTTEHTIVLGGPTDTWGRTWSVAETSDASFRLRVTSNGANNRDFFLDWVPVKVYYEPPAVVTILDAWTTGLTHTVSAGSDRLLLFAVGYENASDPGVSAVSYGTQALSPIIGDVAGTTIVGRVELWYLNDAGIAAASGSTFSVTWGGTAPVDPMYAAATYENVNQSTPISDSASNSTDTTTPNPITATVNVTDGDMAVAAAIAGNNGTYAWGGGWTEGTDQTSGATTTMSSAENAATASGTDTASATHSGPNRQAIVAAVLGKAP